MNVFRLMRTCWDKKSNNLQIEKEKNIYGNYGFVTKWYQSMVTTLGMKKPNTQIDKNKKN